LGWPTPVSAAGFPSAFAILRVSGTTGRRYALCAIPRRANTGTFTKSNTKAKATADNRVPTTTMAGKRVIAIPPPANVEAIAISVIEDATSKRLGREPHKCRRSRMA
jgi:hypothetical protein